MRFNTYPTSSVLSWKRLLFTSTAYIQVHLQNWILSWKQTLWTLTIYNFVIMFATLLYVMFPENQ